MVVDAIRILNTMHYIVTLKLENVNRPLNTTAPLWRTSMIGSRNHVKSEDWIKHVSKDTKTSCTESEIILYLDSIFFNKQVTMT